MTRERQKEFIQELCNHVRDGLLRKAEKVPETWDGRELRRWIALQFGNAVIGEMTRTEVKNFNNELIVRCLL